MKILINVYKIPHSHDEKKWIFVNTTIPCVKAKTNGENISEKL
jgi:hypothetical protein